MIGRGQALRSPTRRSIEMTARFLVLAGVAALTLATAWPAEAQMRSSAKTSLMKRLDTDNDGTLDLAEVKKAAAAKFRRLDGDKDGTLDKKEAKAAGIGAKAFAAADPDKDGTLDEAE